MNVYFSSDHHFSHSNILNFTNFEGDKVRPEFSSVEEMNEAMIERHNSIVGSEDKWYCLGDICFNLKSFHEIMPRLNGKKRLILGNHDRFSMKEYLVYFEKIIESWQPVRHILFTHRPAFFGDMDQRRIFSVHGHVHRTRTDLSPRHLNISLEQTDYYPVSFEWIEEKLKERE